MKESFGVNCKKNSNTRGEWVYSQYIIIFYIRIKKEDGYDELC